MSIFSTMGKIIKNAGKVSFFRKLVENNSGTSSKSFFLVVMTMIGCMLLLVPMIVLIIEAAYNHTINTDLNGMAAYIGAVAALFATAGITKVWGDKYESSEKNKTDDSEEKDA